MVNLIFKLFIAQNGPDERLVEYVRDALKNAQPLIDQRIVESKPRRRKALGTAGLAEYQKALSQVGANPIHDGHCKNCGQDPSVQVGENPFRDLQMIKKTVVKLGQEETLDVTFSNSVARFSEQLPKDVRADSLCMDDFKRMTLEDVDRMTMRAKLNFLNSLVIRLVDKHENDYQLLEERFGQSVSKCRTHGQYLAMQVLYLQQTMEAITDGLSRVSAIVIEHENFVIEERKSRLAGMFQQSETLYCCISQLYQGLKASINVVRDMTRSFVNDEDDDNFDVKYMFDSAVSFKQTLLQQSMQLESAIKLRLDEIRKGPSISAEGLVRKKYITGEDDDDDDPEKAALRRQLSQSNSDLIRRQSSMLRRDSGVSEEDVQKRLFVQQELLEAQSEAKIKEIEKKRDAIAKESTLLLEGLMRIAQEEIDIPPSLANPCFKFLQDQGSQLKRVLRERDTTNDQSQTFHRPFVMTEDAQNQSDEDSFPSVMAMQQELVSRGIGNAVKFGPAAVQLRRALLSGRDVLTKYSSNAVIFQEFSKILKLELAHLLNPRMRDQISMPNSEAELYRMDAIVNTQMTLTDFEDVEQRVGVQMKLEEAALLINMAKEGIEKPAKESKKKKPAAAEKQSPSTNVAGSVDIPISPRTAAMAAYPEQMMALISPDSILPLEDRIKRRLIEKNGQLLARLRAFHEEREKGFQTEQGQVHSSAMQTDPMVFPTAAPDATQQEIMVTSTDEPTEGKSSKKGKKGGGKRSASVTPSEGKRGTKPPLRPSR